MQGLSHFETASFIRHTPLSRPGRGRAARSAAASRSEGGAVAALDLGSGVSLEMVACPGVALISAGGAQALDGFASFGRGELFTLLCAAAFALEIVMVGILAPGTSVRRFTFVELAATSLLSFACMPLAGEALPRNMLEPACLACGLGAATALLQSVVVWAQKSIPPSRATVIYTGEPVWGGFFGWLAGERLGAGALAGCALIVAGILISGKKGRPKAPERPSRKQSGARQSGAKPS